MGTIVPGGIVNDETCSGGGSNQRPEVQYVTTGLLRPHQNNRRNFLIHRLIRTVEGRHLAVPIRQVARYIYIYIYIYIYNIYILQKICIFEEWKYLSIPLSPAQCNNINSDFSPNSRLSMNNILKLKIKFWWPGITNMIFILITFLHIIKDQNVKRSRFRVAYLLSIIIKRWSHWDDYCLSWWDPERPFSSVVLTQDGYHSLHWSQYGSVYDHWPLLLSGFIPTAR